MKNNFETYPVLEEKTPENFFLQNNFPEVNQSASAPEEHWSQRFIREYEVQRILWRLQYLQSLVGQMEKQMGILTDA